MYEAHCLSCGAKTRIAQGQPPPRCPHCWTPLIPVVEAHTPPPGGDPVPAGAGKALGALLAKGWEPRRYTDKSPKGMTTCHLCGMFVEPQRFCSECGAPLPDGVPAV